MFYSLSLAPVANAQACCPFITISLVGVIQDRKSVWVNVGTESLRGLGQDVGCGCRDQSRVDVEVNIVKSEHYLTARSWLPGTLPFVVEKHVTKTLARQFDVMLSLLPI